MRPAAASADYRYPRRLDFSATEAPDPRRSPARAKQPTPRTSRMNRLLTAFVAWVVGAITYLIAAIRWGGYDGFPDLVIMPMCAAVISAVAVGLAVLIGWPFRSTPLGRWWRSSRLWAIIFIIGSLTLLNFGSAIGLIGMYTDPTTGEQFTALHPAAAIVGYFLLIFAVAHWPLARQLGKA
jgi:hypothetical protein